MDILLATVRWFHNPNTGSAMRYFTAPARAYLLCADQHRLLIGHRFAAGIALGYWRKGAFLIINLFNIGRAIPSLGLILLCIILFGFNDVPVLPRWWPCRFPVLTNTGSVFIMPIARFATPPPALGMTPWQSLWQLRIPLAAPLIIAGLRTALVQLIATAVVAAYAGLGGLGRFLIDGLGQRDIPQVIAGSLVVSLLAIGSELLFSCCSRKWSHTAIAPEY